MIGKRVHDKELILRQFLLVILDAAAVAVSSVLALMLRIEFSFEKIQGPYLENIWQTLLPDRKSVV